MMLVAAHYELAGDEVLRIDEDPHRVSVTEDHCGSSVLARTFTLRMPACTNSSASGSACGVRRPDRIKRPPGAVRATRCGLRSRNTCAWMFASTIGNSS